MLEELQKKQNRRQQLLEQINTLPAPYDSSLHDKKSWLALLAEATEKQEMLNEQLENHQEHIESARHQRHRDETALTQAKKDLTFWLEQQRLSDSLLGLNESLTLLKAEDLNTTRRQQTTEQSTLSRQELLLDEELKNIRLKLRGLDQTESKEQQQLLRLAELTNAQLITQFYDDDDISIEEAAWLEAKLGPLRNALLVEDIEAAAHIIRAETDRPEDVWLLQGESGASFSEDEYLSTPIEQEEDGNVLVNLTDNIARITQEPEYPTIGRLARLKEQERLIEREEQILDERQTIAVFQKKIQHILQLLDELAPVARWIGHPKPDIQTLEEILESRSKEIAERETEVKKCIALQYQLKKAHSFLELHQTSADLLEETNLQQKSLDTEALLTQCQQAQDWLERHSGRITELERRRLFLDTPPAKDLEAFRKSLEQLNLRISTLGKQLDQLRDAEQKLPFLRYKDSVHRQNETSTLRTKLKQEWEEKDSRKRVQIKELELIKEQLQGLDKNIFSNEEEIKRDEGQLLLKKNEINNIPLNWHPQSV